jgi:hypothetical protein
MTDERRSRERRHSIRFTQKAWGAIAAIIVATTLESVGIAAAVPQAPTILEAAGNQGGSFLVTMPDGAVDWINTQMATNGLDVMRRRSFDKGVTWSTPQRLCGLSREEFGTTVPYVTMPLMGQNGNLQLFWMVERGTGNNPAVDLFYDIRQAHSSGNVTTWTNTQRIFEGYVGSINGVTQLPSGRIVLPFAYWIAKQPAGPPYGNNVVTTVYSDNGGDTWQQSTAALRVPCYPNYNGDNLGAVEPTIVNLKDGRAWMLIRTQTGFLYESYSQDGANWSDPVQTRFRSTDSPAGLLRVPDGRLIAFWNNCENTSPINGKGVYTTRDAIHAAISSDDGKTWHGYREVYRDPTRNDSPPRTGDRGTAYPYPVATADGTVLLITGQATGRRALLSFDPDWLEITHAEDDFSNGLDDWSVFKSFGEPINWWRDRVQGAVLVDHPTKAGAKALHVRRPDDKDGDGAVWNFPAGRRGKVELSFQLQTGFKGGSIALADRFIQPTDSVGEANANLVLLSITGDGRLPDGTVLTSGQWYQLGLQWDLDRDICQILLNGQPTSTLPILNEDPLSAGASYLRFRSTASTVDNAGLLVEWVRADVTVPEPSAMALVGSGAAGFVVRRFCKHKR